MGNPIGRLVNGYFNWRIGGSKRPVFFDIAHTCYPLNQVTHQFPTIATEYKSLSSQALKPYHELDDDQGNLSRGSESGDWSVFLLHAMGYQPKVAGIHCPKTLELLESIPGLFQAFFSVLPPGKSIPLHQGSYKGYIRYHLALEVPSESPPILKVHNQEYEWKEGEAMMFDDSWPHEVVNNSKEIRAVLVIDVLRSFKFPLNWLNTFLGKTVIKHLYGRKLVNKANA